MKFVTISQQENIMAFTFVMVVVASSNVLYADPHPGCAEAMKIVLLTRQAGQNVALVVLRNV